MLENMYERPILWKGNSHTNYSSREGNIPFAICNHISDGTIGSMDNWFTDPGNTVSSAHFGVSRTGDIHQYVAIEQMAWANGNDPSSLPANFQLASVAKDMKMNPNLYTVSIEHEGHDGTLTDAQFWSSVWLHFYIKNYIMEKYGKRFDLNAYHVIGHFQVSPYKPNCPGPNFPWTSFYTTFKEVQDQMNLVEQLQKQVDGLQQRVAQLEGLSTMKVPDWAKAAIEAATETKPEPLVNNPDGGSYDFYRIMTILDRMGLIPKK